MQVLLVDDDPTALVCGQKKLSNLNPELEIQTASDAETAMKFIKSESPLVVVLDLCLNESSGVESGFQLLRKILSYDSSTRIIVLTGYSTDDHGIRAIAEGAASFLSKPVSYEHLLALIHDGIVQANLKRAYKKLLKDKKPELGKYLVGESSFNQELIRTLDYASKSDQGILITGETGTGKGYCASLIHRFSSRSNNQFVALQPIFTNPDLVNSELFGHSKGSFTGAESKRKGLFTEAHLGTLFLDEIDSFSPEIQVALLGVLQSKKFRKLGSNQLEDSDFRLISATNQDLERTLEEKRLRQDLYFRIAHLRIHLLPLRDRMEDLPALAKLLLNQTNPDLRIRPEAIDRLYDHYWPGNIRELESVITNAAEKAKHTGRYNIIPDDIQFLYLQTSEQPSNLRQQVKEYKYKLVKAALDRNNQSKALAAKELGIDRGTLTRIMQKN